MVRPAASSSTTSRDRERWGTTFLTTPQLGRGWGIALLAFIVWAVPSLAWGQKVPVGAEFEVNSYTTGEQGGYYDRPRVASDSAGNFVVTWPGDSVATGEYGHVWARRFDSTGTAIGTEFQVSTSYSPQCCWGREGEDWDGLEIASDAVGNFMVVWNQNNNDVFGRVFDSTGVPAGPDFAIDTGGDVHYPQAGVVADGAGHFIVAWTGHRDEEIRGRW